MRFRYLFGMAGALIGAGFFTGCTSGDAKSDGGVVSALKLGPSAVLPELESGLLKDPSPLPADRELADLSEEGLFVRGLQPAVVIDTRQFSPQIIRADVPTSASRRVKAHLPAHTRPKAAADQGFGERGSFVMGGVADEQTVDPSSVASFTGMDRTGWGPPDPSIAVGPGHVVETVNQSIAFYTRGGRLQFQQVLGSQGTPGFFEPVGAGTFTFDPKCLYDHDAERFVVLALEVYDGQGSAYVTIAVSDDSDPNGVWYKYRTDAVTLVNGAPYWWDYPGLGVDAEGYYVTSNLFRLGGSGYAGTGFRVYNKAPMLTGAPAEFWSARDGSVGSVQCVSHFGDNAADGGAAYFVSGNGGRTLRVHAITNPVTTPELIDITVGVPRYTNGGNAETMGGGNIYTLDNRVMNAVWRDGNLYTAHAVGVGGMPKPRWYDVSLNGWPGESVFPRLTQTGTIDPGEGIAGFFPAVAVNDAGDLGIVYGTSSSTERIGLWVTARRASDPEGEMGEPVLVRRSGSQLSSTTGQRWGDYYDAALDPADGLTFWGVGQTQESGDWDSRVLRFAVTPAQCAEADLAEPFGELDLSDITAFVEGFTARQDISDLVPDGVWDLADIGAFVESFEAGCP